MVLQSGSHTPTEFNLDIVSYSCYRFQRSDEILYSMLSSCACICMRCASCFFCFGV
jgi:hypothetical protein